MRIQLAQNTTGMEAGSMAGSMSSGSMASSGFNRILAAPNIAGTPQSYGATDATMMRASGGPTPGLPDVKPGSSSKNSSDIEILNAALLLEYLESEFYARVVAADQARPYLKGRVQYAANILARDEATHVQTVTDLITKLGGTPISKPQFQFPSEVFITPFAFLNLSVELEENGVGAYLGAAPMVKNKDVLNFAASIYGNEARHTAWIRYLRGGQFAPNNMEHPRTIAEATGNAAPYLVNGTTMPSMS